MQILNLVPLFKIVIYIIVLTGLTLNADSNAPVDFAIDIHISMGDLVEYDSEEQDTDMDQLNNYYHDFNLALDYNIKLESYGLVQKRFTSIWKPPQIS